MSTFGIGRSLGAWDTSHETLFGRFVQIRYELAIGDTMDDVVVYPLEDLGSLPCAR
jgi:hypothetical protein